MPAVGRATALTAAIVGLMVATSSSPAWADIVPGDGTDSETQVDADSDEQAR